MPATKVRTTRLIAVEQIAIPAWSTIGYGLGVDEDGRRVRFAGDHRLLRQLCEACAAFVRSVCPRMPSCARRTCHWNRAVSRLGAGAFGGRLRVA